jgi:ATP-dependent Lon protease
MDLLAKHRSLPLPDEMPVMVLSECFLFPGCLLPLFIFEERYQTMLKHALATNRMFCIGVRCEADGRILPWSTAGLVRVCMTNDDGTSQLVLAGLRRIRLTGWVQEKPFRIARITPVPTVVAEEPRMARLREEAISRLPLPKAEDCASIRHLHDALLSVPDPELACDLMAYHFVQRPEVLARMLAEPSLEARYATLLEHLRAPSAS